MPGAGLGVLHNDSATTAYYGVADVTTGEAVTAETRFSAGSLTKSMVATVVARLAQEGRLSLEDPVADHVPELRGSSWAQRAAVRDLLANRSGLPMRNALEFGFDSHADADDGALARLASEVSGDGPHTNFWSYTNVGWCVLGRVIETTTGASWEAAMRRYLFETTDMGTTTFANEAVSVRRAAGHEVTPNGPVPVEQSAARAYAPAGTTVVTTVTDLLRFAAMHLQDPTLRHLRDVHGEVAIYGWLDAWCLGWARFDWEGGQVWGWDGLIDGERSFLRILPEHHAAIVLMTNGSTGRAMYRSLIAELMPSLFAISLPPLRLDPAISGTVDLSPFAGVYAWPDRKVEVETTTNGLVIKQDVLTREALPLNGRTFVVDRSDPDNPTVTFEDFDAIGRPRVLYLMLWGLPRVD